MSNFSEVLQYLTSLSPEKKGLAFEHYCKWFLENGPYKPLVKKVWLWYDWPEKWGRDKGIDLIAETHQGEVWAIQAKAYDELYAIKKEDVDKFISESNRDKISFRLLIATTNDIGANAREVISAQEKQFKCCLLDALQASNLIWPTSIDALWSAVPIQKKIPRDYQLEAVEKIIEGFKTSSVGQVHMACGTGKTLVGLWAKERLQSRTTLVLVPSISLVSQLYDEWSAHANADFYPIFVCSDTTVAPDNGDAINIHAEDMRYPVTTDAAEIARCLIDGDKPKVVFSTYHSSPMIKEACKNNSAIAFDLVIADEAHRCAGKVDSAFATILDQHAISARTKLFMTATPKILSDHVKKVAADAECNIISMDDPVKFGPVFHSFSFSQAIKKGLLSDYQVLVSVIDDKTYREYAERGRFVAFNEHETDARTLATQIMVAKAIKKYGLQKIITFHSRQKNAHDFASTLPQALALLDEQERPRIGFSDVLFGDMYQSERIKRLKKFDLLADTSFGLLANVRCLAEGIDVPTLDGIAFVDPKGSEIDIVQAVGRAIRKSENKKIGTIIIPIFVDAMTNETLALEQSCFKVVWKVIKALRAHDDVLAEELDTIRLELGKRMFKQVPGLNKIIINVPVGIGSEFSEAIKIKLAENCAQISLMESHPALVLEWHTTKNGNITPKDVTAGSNKKVWWKCSKGVDHEWETTIGNRTYGYGCPVCTNQLIVLSNCLATTHPELSLELHPTRNGSISSYTIAAGSGRRVWWKCPNADDHEWNTSVEKRTKGKTGCPACANRLVVTSNCLANLNPILAEEWHPTKNGNLMPHHVAATSGTKIWWKCRKADDHEWKASVAKRATGDKTSCPVCTNKLIVLSNCLATTHPDLVVEWHPTKNGNITPTEVAAGSNKKVWWKCSKGPDHEWIVSIGKRTSKKSGCPVCANRLVVLSNCLATTHPELSLEWHPTKNGNVTPMDVTAGGNKKVWWKCSKGPDHEWITSIVKRTLEHTGCPICANQKVVLSNCLAITNPDLASQWHPTKNGEKTPYNTLATSGKKVWWQCQKEEDHAWQASVKTRNQGIGCSACAGRTIVLSNCLALTHPDLSREWHPFKNGSITPFEVYAGSHSKAWWRCSRNSGHEWYAEIRSRSRQNGTGCPDCYKITRLSVPST